MSRRVSFGCSRAAASGSTCCSRWCRALSRRLRGSLSRTCWRKSQSAGGPLKMPRSSPFRYSGVPPTNSTSRPRPRSRRRTPPAASTYCARLNSSVRFDHVDQVMRAPLQLGRRGLGRADVHAAIQGHRVHRDDFGVQPFGQFQAHAVLPLAVGPVRNQQPVAAWRHGRWVGSCGNCQCDGRRLR